uniref:Death domain-containing protein n=1 Tax=Megaselia scalaris TaxID=36166 RepID=T1GM09_MEGSC
MDNSERQEIISRLGLTSMCISRSYEPYHKPNIPRQSSTEDTQHFIGDMRIVDVSNLLGDDWMCLAPEIGITPTEVSNIKAQNENSVAQQAQAMIQLFKVKKNNDQNILENGLKNIGREDIIRKCVTVRKRIHLDAPHETDNMKMSESVEELMRREDISRLQQLHEREEFKYSAEEKEVEESESDEEMHKRTVAEDDKKSKNDFHQEITEIKRKSLIEDKKAIHEEEILMQMPTDNSHKSSVVPEQVIKLKHSKLDGGDAVDKGEFDKELQDKFKKTVRLSDEEEDFLVEENEPASKIDIDIQDSEKQKRSQIPVASKRSSQIFSEDGIKVKVIETEDPDLEDKLSKQKAKIEQEIDDIVPKTYTEKPRESLTEEQFIKSVEDTITKKMSEGRIEISDADIAKNAARLIMLASSILLIKIVLEIPARDEALNSFRCFDWINLRKRGYFCH